MDLAAHGVDRTEGDSIVAERLRLEALASYQVLDSPPESSYDRLTGLASSMLRTPMAAFALVDGKREWMKSAVGLDRSWIARGDGVAEHVVAAKSPLVVSDLRESPFAGKPWVRTAPFARFYAGIPIIDEDGEALGAFCVMDIRPRLIETELLRALGVLGEQAATLLALRRANLELEGARTVEVEQALELRRNSAALGRILASATALVGVADAEVRPSRNNNLIAGALYLATEHAVFATDSIGHITFFNTGAERMLGYREADVLGRGALEFHDRGEIESRARELGLAPGFDALVADCRSGRAATREWTYVTNDKRRLTVSLTISAMVTDDGDIVGFAGMAKDVTDARRTERALDASEKRFRMAFDDAPIGMALVGVQGGELGRYLLVNRAMCQMTGYADTDLIGQSISFLAHPDDRATTEYALQRMPTGELDHWQVERRYRHADGHTIWARLSVSVVHGDDGTPVYNVAQIEDITARKEAEATLIHLSLHDPLTGVANRTLLRDRIDHALAASTRSHDKVGLVYIDLDGFKHVNDSDGHAAGDEVLVRVAERLIKVVRPGDTVARLGGDEFVAVCVDIDDMDQLTAVGSRVLETLREPFHCSTGTYHLSASIGLTTSDDASETDQLLAGADAAMYVAKRRGRDRMATSPLEEIARANRFARLIPELHEALGKDELIMYGQPIIDMSTGATVAVETLIRWQHPERGVLPPSEFLDAAEHSPLMVALGRRALSESCRMAATWVTQFGESAPDVHVNVSGRQLESGNLTEDVVNALATAGLSAEHLVLELTETHMPVLTDSLLKDLTQLRELGLRIAIDDLGTGHSSLTRITELPVDILKIDLRFTARLGTDPACDAVVRAVIGIGDAMGLSVVAEGVENTRQAELLRSYGCQKVQGYLYSRPRPEDELVQAFGIVGGAQERTTGRCDA